MPREGRPPEAGRAGLSDRLSSGMCRLCPQGGMIQTAEQYQFLHHTPWPCCRPAAGGPAPDPEPSCQGPASPGLGKGPAVTWGIPRGPVWVQKLASEEARHQLLSTPPLPPGGPSGHRGGPHVRPGSPPQTTRAEQPEVPTSCSSCTPCLGLAKLAPRSYLPRFQPRTGRWPELGEAWCCLAASPASCRGLCLLTHQRPGHPKRARTQTSRARTGGLRLEGYKK